MAIAYISSAYANGGSISPMPSHSTGDLLVMFIPGNGAIPPLQAGWTSAGTGNFWRVAYKIATSGSETSGTWTYCLGLHLGVYQGFNELDPIGAVSGSYSSSTTLTYPALTLDTADATSWVARAGRIGTGEGSPTVDTPSGFTSRDLDESAGTYSARFSDSNAGVASSVSAHEQALGGVQIWHTASIEIQARPDGALFWAFP